MLVLPEELNATTAGSFSLASVFADLSRSQTKRNLYVCMGVCAHSFVCPVFRLFGFPVLVSPLSKYQPCLNTTCTGSHGYAPAQGNPAADSKRTRAASPELGLLVRADAEGYTSSLRDCPMPLELGHLKKAPI